MIYKFTKKTKLQAVRTTKGLKPGFGWVFGFFSVFVPRHQIARPTVLYQYLVSEYFHLHAQMIRISCWQDRKAPDTLFSPSWGNGPVLKRTIKKLPVSILVTSSVTSEVK